jgi:hypothetical protein
MQTLLGIPIEGWKAISVWLLVMITPWTYTLYFLRRIDRSGVKRWGASVDEAGPGGRE